MSGSLPAATAGSLLGGRVAYAQPAAGYRTGIEPVLLAAAIPARPADAVLELGTGAGAALLCLAHRVPDLRGAGVEQDPAVAALAEANIAANGWQHRLSVQNLDVANIPADARFAHAFANPPWHDPRGTPSPTHARNAAKRAGAGLLAAWVAIMADRLEPRGTITLALPAASLPEALVALQEAACGGAMLLPLWPKAGREARLILLQGRKGIKSPARVLPGLILHQPDGGFTPEAEAVLRDGAGLPLG